MLLNIHSFVRLFIHLFVCLFVYFSDITQNSNELRFEVFDKSKHPGGKNLNTFSVYFRKI